MTFAVNRLKAVQGSGARSGVWEFDDFPLQDSILGRATVEYDVTWIKIDSGARAGQWELEVKNPRVTKLVVFDDDGWAMNISDDFRPFIEAAFIEAFNNQLERVEEFEMGER